MTLQDAVEIAANFVGLVTLFLFAFSYGPAIDKAGQLMGVW
jgi:hypothetical protein